ncbi:MAG: hypothetical protein ACC662_02950 [Planctomycetota bacterium]
MKPTCPTCGAAFRGRDRCGRCGTDLERLGALARAAHALRERAREALHDGDAEAALDRAARSRLLHDVEAGRRLHALALIAADRPREGLHLAATILGERGPARESPPLLARGDGGATPRRQAGRS